MFNPSILETYEARQKYADAALERYQKNYARNPQGFRAISLKPGAARVMTWPDTLAFILVGTKALPRRIPGRRGTETARERHAFYLQRVKETKGNLPTGDTRLKAAA